MSCEKTCSTLFPILFPLLRYHDISLSCHHAIILSCYHLIILFHATLFYLLDSIKLISFLHWLKLLCICTMHSSLHLWTSQGGTISVNGITRWLILHSIYKSTSFVLRQIKCSTLPHIVAICLSTFPLSCCIFHIAVLKVL